jgi:NADH-quinone oxidoreductase subunit M
MSSNSLILPALLLWPVLAAALLWIAPGPQAARRRYALAMGSELLLALLALFGFDPGTAGFQLQFSVPWMPALGIHYALGVDGLSVLFLPATSALFLAIGLASWRQIETRATLYYTLLLLQLAATLLIFCALDTLLFFLAWELSLLPFFFLSVLWGVGPGRRFMATKYTLIMLAGGIPLLLGLLLAAYDVGQVTGGSWVFDLPTLYASPVSAPLQPLLFALLLLGFAAKTPMFPLHTWLPSMAMEGPMPAGALLVGLKLGAFGLLRLLLPLTPGVAIKMGWLLAALGVIALLYGAVAAVAQTNLRRTLAYASFSHVGLVLLGIASFSPAGVQGAVLQLLNFTLIAGGLFILTGFMVRRTGTADTLHLGGLFHRMPRLAALFAVFSLAAVGVPGFSSFPAELLLLTSALRSHTGAGLAALFAGVIAAAYTLGALRKAFFGPAKTPLAIAGGLDLRARELAVAGLLLLPVALIGLAPGWVLDVIAHGLSGLKLPG